MRFFTRAILIVAIVALATTANAIGPGGKGGGGGGGGGGDSSLIVFFNPDQIAQVINAAGFKAQVIMNGKIKMVRVDFGWGSDVFSGVAPLNCNDKGQCPGMVMFANDGKNDAATPEWVNGFNNSWPYVKAVKTKDGDLIFEWETLVVGVAPDDIALMAKWFKQIVDKASE